MMIRRLLLYLSHASWARNTATHWGLARRVALRFVAGETLEQAVQVTKQLNQQGLLVTLNYLGESVTQAEDTREIIQTYQQLATQIHEHDLQASISIKPTHLGLDISEDLCLANLREIFSTTQQHAIPITIDMESSQYIDMTLRLYRALRDDFDHAGTVIQAYLYRSAEDMVQLAAENAHIRLVKGAYLEPESIAFPEKTDVDANFVTLTRDFLSSSDAGYLCLATHDEKMIQAAQEIINDNAISSDRYEYQMLLGVRTDRQAELVKAGYKMRVYVPFGTTWYPYFVRRLAERPANLWFFMKMLFGK